MSTRYRILACFTVALAVFLILSGVLWATKDSASYQKCDAEQKESPARNKSANSPQERTRRFIVCEAYFLGENNGLINAIGTLVVAAFTFYVWRATRRQAGINDRLATITHRQFAADHRPRIKVRWIEPAHDDIDDPSGRRIAAYVHFRNTGANEARVILIHARILRGFSVSPRDLMTFPAGMRQMDKRLGTGQGDREFIDSDLRDIAEHRRIAVAEAQHVPPETIFLIGRIQYLDQHGATWETGFCYKLLFPNLVWDYEVQFELNYED